ncbi:hypothetical protein G3I34_08100 [Streptomyces sp. SID8014]|uniref:hypothetical protein n=1 Tax=Streptomyces sp. SID8014 TaxID=2706097 RepID=UPI0013B8379F|nr:hypothetical protein [Streptomyces sp. SID8014]NEC12249.1 hypothetical protein [Streptomyces sp. SID8014]
MSRSRTSPAPGTALSGTLDVIVADGRPLHALDHDLGGVGWALPSPALLRAGYAGRLVPARPAGGTEPVKIG